MTKDGATLAVVLSSLSGNLFALLPVPVAIVDAQGQIVLANSTFNDFFPDTTNVNQIPHHEVRVENSATYDFETLPLTEQGLSIFLGRETTAEGKLRNQLVHMEKMGAIGRLVSGVAHELNNPLAGIVGYAQLLSRADLDPSTHRMVKVVQNQAERAGRIVRNFLNLATKTEPEKRAFSLTGVVENVLQLREYDHSVRDIVVSRDLAGDLPLAVGDASQIEQVVLNLMVNAEDAVISAQNRVREIQIRTMVLNNRIRLEVADNGGGIRSDDMGRIFDRFSAPRRTRTATAEPDSASTSVRISSRITAESFMHGATTGRARRLPWSCRSICRSLPLKPLARLRRPELRSRASRSWLSTTKPPLLNSSKICSVDTGPMSTSSTRFRCVRPAVRQVLRCDHLRPADAGSQRPEPLSDG